MKIQFLCLEEPSNHTFSLNNDGVAKWDVDMGNAIRTLSLDKRPLALAAAAGQLCVVLDAEFLWLDLDLNITGRRRIG